MHTMASVSRPSPLFGPMAILAQSQEGQLRDIDVPLTVRAIAGTLFGLLTLQLLGDEVIATRWEELPEVLTSLLFDGLQLG